MTLIHISQILWMAGLLLINFIGGMGGIIVGFFMIIIEGTIIVIVINLTIMETVV